MAHHVSVHDRVRFADHCTVRVFEDNSEMSLDGCVPIRVLKVHDTAALDAGHFVLPATGLSDHQVNEYIVAKGRVGSRAAHICEGVQGFRSAWLRVSLFSLEGAIEETILGTRSPARADKVSSDLKVRDTLL